MGEILSKQPGFRVKFWDETVQDYRPISAAADVGIVTTQEEGLITKLPGKENLYFNGLGFWEKIKGLGSLYMFEVDEYGDLYQIYFDDDEIQEFELEGNGDFWAVFDDDHRLYLGNLRDEIFQEIEQGGTGASTRHEAIANLFIQNKNGSTYVGENGNSTDWWFDNNAVTLITEIKDDDWLPGRILKANDLSEENPAIVFTLPYYLDGKKMVFQILLNTKGGFFFRYSYNTDTWTPWSPGSEVDVGFRGLVPPLPEEPPEG